MVEITKENTLGNRDSVLMVEITKENTLGIKDSVLMVEITKEIHWVLGTLY